MDGFVVGTAHLVLIVTVQFLLVSWGLFLSVLTPSYLFMNIGLLAFGVMGIIQPGSAHIVLLHLFTLILSILNDVILLGIYAHNVEVLADYDASKPTARFSLGMEIVHLLLKPLVAFLLVKLFVARGGDFKDFFRQLAGRGEGHPGYDEIDRESRTETASPHQRVNEYAPIS